MAKGRLQELLENTRAVNQGVFCVRCSHLVMTMNQSQLLGDVAAKVLAHGGVCENPLPKSDRRRLVKATAVVPGQLAIQLPGGE